jgi:hypothetical protein
MRLAHHRLIGKHGNERRALVPALQSLHGCEASLSSMESALSPQSLLVLRAAELALQNMH